MPQTIFRYLILFILLILAQVLICNHIMIFGVAMPIIFIYFILHLPMGLNPKWVLTLGFLTGFVIDVFSNTPGVNALSCTILAMIRRPIFRMFTGGDEQLAHIVPGIATMSFASFAKYVFTLVFIYCILSFSLEYFTFAYFGRMLLKICASTLLTSAILIGIDGLIKRN